MATPRTDTVVIGGGQAGLAVSWHLTVSRRDHVVIERGRVGHRWRVDGWDSLRLLTPNWMSRLPGWSYRHDDPDGYLPAAGLVEHLQRYADAFGAPVLTGTAVLSVRKTVDGFAVSTDRGTWHARHVVVATGACAQPFIPDAAARLRASLEQVTPATYRNPGALPPGGVLVVGASASGAQIARELCQAGRRVILAVGQHTRVPRRYRGMDIWWWLERLGRLDRPIDTVPDPDRARREPSLQLVGRPGEDLDLGTLAEAGVVLGGRLIGVDGDRVRFADDLAATTRVAEARLRRLLDAVDSHVVTHGLTGEVLAPRPFRPLRPAPAITELDLAAAGIGTVVWATGYRPSYPWLQLPVLDGRGEIRQHRGLTPVAGLYAVGLRFGQRRSSGLLDGVRHDARTVVGHLTSTGRASRTCRCRARSAGDAE